MGTGQGGFEHTQESHKIDASLNELVGKLRTITVASGADAYVLFKQGQISKKELLELIAKRLSE